MLIFVVLLLSPIWDEPCAFAEVQGWASHPFKLHGLECSVNEPSPCPFFACKDHIPSLVLVETMLSDFYQKREIVKSKIAGFLCYRLFF